jgi:hypothetical protein
VADFCATALGKKELLEVHCFVSLFVSSPWNPCLWSFAAWFLVYSL